LPFGRDLVGDRLVVSRLRFLYVRDGDQANLKTLLRLLQLTGNRLAVCIEGGKSVFRSQNVEVGLADTDDQVLLSRFTIRFGLGDHFISATQTNDLVPAENGLAQTNRPARRFRFSFGGNGHRQTGAVFEYAVSRRIVFEITGIGVDLRQVQTACLGLCFECCQSTRFCFMNPRVALQRLLVYLEQ
jgi:hypothetical protein